MADGFSPSAYTKRVAVISHTHPSISKGGAEIAAYTLFNGLLALGVDAVFIAACAEQDRGRLSLASTRERAIFHEPLLYDHLYQLGSPAVARELHRTLAEESVQIVNFHHFMNFGIGGVRRIAADAAFSTFVTLHEFLAICHHHGQMITRPARMLCERATPAACHACFPEVTRPQFAMRADLFQESLANVDGFISPSRFLAERFAEWGLPSAKMNVVENGLSHRPAARAPRRGAEQAPWVFGFFGQINPFKGVDTILKAVEIIAQNRALAQRIQIRLHGNVIGQAEGFMKQFEAALEKHKFLSYAGAYDNSAVARLMDECDYVLVPSSWWENSPVVIQEAYAVGRPVVCSGIGGMAEKVRNGVSGLHFRPQDAGDLVRVLREAAQSEIYETLLPGIPPVEDAAGMAKAYLRVFETAAAEVSYVDAGPVQHTG